jgi:hydroxyacylglutathione hydrolase
VVRDPDQDLDEVLWQARKIGYDGLAGEVAGGMPAWVAAGLPVVTTPLLAPAEVDVRRLVDVRQPNEFAAGHARGASNVELGALTTTAFDGPVVTMCGHGERAATGASLLERAGHRDVAMVTAGPDAWP